MFKQKFCSIKHQCRIPVHVLIPEVSFLSFVFYRELKEVKAIELKYFVLISSHKTKWYLFQ